MKVSLPAPAYRNLFVAEHSPALALFPLVHVYQRYRQLSLESYGLTLHEAALFQ